MSNRQLDPNNGYLRVENSILTRAEVSQYLGKELPLLPEQIKELNIQPDEVYNVLRPLDELQKSIESFNGVPLLDRHIEVTADSLANEHKQYLIGSVGNDARVEADNTVRAFLSFLTSREIRYITDGEIEGLSVGYKYTPVLESGEYEGDKYDIKMTDIIVNHVALVEDPRVQTAGVADSNSIISKETTMKKKRKVAFVGDSAALVARLFKKANINNPKLQNRIKLAMDEEAIKDQDTTDEGPNFDEMAKGIMDAMGGYDEVEAQQKAISDMLQDAFGAKDDEPTTDEEPTGDDEPTNDGDGADDEEPTADEAGEPLSMDSARKLINTGVRKGIDSYKAQLRAYDSAINLAERVLGTKVNQTALDSAEKIFNAVLTSKGIAFDGKTTAQKYAMVELLATQPRANQRQGVTMDSKSSAEVVDASMNNFFKRG
ncbi:MAG: DUF2213 domain-containing protein [Neisseriaceae bacterium]|nr:MAG: DUF2213 domain-containing protein [Neisseriaceae bacterium]